MNSIYVSYSEYGSEKTFKVVHDKDCIPSNTVKIWESITTADMLLRSDRSERFWHFYESMKWVENLGFNLCIDFGDYFYETGMLAPEIGVLRV